MNRQFLRATLLTVLAMFASPAILAEEVWIDVRSAFEHKIDRIDGDIRMSHSDIVAEVSRQFPDKDTDIRLYCRSGGRAGKAQAALEEAGYRNVKNIGGIGEARRERGLDH